MYAGLKLQNIQMK